MRSKLTFLSCSCRPPLQDAVGVANDSSVV